MKKFDLTKTAAFAREALAEIRKEDGNYTWTLKAVNKGSIKFNWSYLSKNEVFTLTVNETMGDIYVEVEIPCGASKVFLLIGEDRWSDAQSVEMGVYKAIKAAARKAMHLF